MSGFEAEFQRAKRRQRRHITLAVVAVVAAILAAGLLFLATTIERIEVVIAPGEAGGNADIDIVRGNGIVWGGELWALPGPLTLQAGAEGFSLATVDVAQAAKRRGRIDIVLRELAASLEATTAPVQAGTHWFLDGILVAEGVRIDLELPAGEHIVEARHPHYLPASRTVVAGRGESLAAVLPLVPVEGRIVITSEPGGARVIWNGKAAGHTPLTLAVPGGVHELAVVLESHDTRSDRIEITHAASVVERHYRLASTRGRVSFALSPPDGTLSVDGRIVPLPATLELVPDTGYVARYSSPGYTSQEVEFTLLPGEKRLIGFELAPVFGMVELRSDPEADVEIDGRKIGRTPMDVELQTVPQTIRLTQQGYRAETRTITPEEGRISRIAVTLMSEAQARLASARLRYTTSTGIEMKLFGKPGDVTLGTPRGEPYRRANEFVRDVRLAKPFYASVHEVTVAQFRQFAATGHAPGSGRHPVTGIGWEDAARYCNWLSNREGFMLVYRFVNGRYAGSSSTADGYRLPTEAEWEWLARKAGRERQSRFPWGDDTTVPAGSGNLADESAAGTVPVYIPHYDDGHAGIAEVGLFSPNDSGLHDLAGNAREWMHDAYDPRPPPRASSAAIDPMDTDPARWHVVKGSSWRSGTLDELRAAWRDGKSRPQDDIGFRIARYVTKGT